LPRQVFFELLKTQAINYSFKINDLQINLGARLETTWIKSGGFVKRISVHKSNLIMHLHGRKRAFQRPQAVAASAAICSDSVTRTCSVVAMRAPTRIALATASAGSAR
jgi:hypothetical protein